jgi:hypothetical protein
MVDRPSFEALYASMKRQHEWLNADHGVRHPIWGLNPKMAGRSLAASLGVRVPQLLAGPTSAERLAEPDAERFVVKPDRGHSGQGVYALVRDGDRLLWSVLDDRAISWEEVRGSLAASAEAGHISRELLIEELLSTMFPKASSSARSARIRGACSGLRQTSTASSARRGSGRSPRSSPVQSIGGRQPLSASVRPSSGQSLPGRARGRVARARATVPMADDTRRRCAALARL